MTTFVRILSTYPALLTAVVLAGNAEAHDGRRFQVELAVGQLVAQGVNTGNFDGAPDRRPYRNVIHDHWQNSPLIGSNAATASFPEFDILSPAAELQFRPLELRLLGVTKWVDPPPIPPPGTVPSFESLPSDEILSLTLNGETIDSQSLGSLFLATSVPPNGLSDIPATYAVNRRPANEIYVIETQLASSNPAVLPSDSVYILLSPDGASPMERLHHAALYLEEYIVTHPIPEPTAIAVALLGVLVVGVNYRR